MTNKYIGPTTVAYRPHHPNFQGFKKKADLPRDVLPILAIDPGVTTGWSLLVLRKTWCGKEIFSWPFDVVIEHKLSWTHGEIDCGEEDLGSYQLMKTIREWPSAAVVVEDFILRTDRREKSRELLSPVRITANLRHHLWRLGRTMILQQPSMAKTTVTDERLKLWGCYSAVGGLRHARDADRHALTFIRRCYGAQGFPLRALAWPHIYNVVTDAKVIKIGQGFNNYHERN